MKTKQALILEDDLETVSVLVKRIQELEEELESTGKGDIAVTVLSEFTQVEEYINKTEHPFDVIQLDRDCKAAGSLHVIDFEKFGVDRIIGISSTPPYNEELRKRGITRIVHKDYSNLLPFSYVVLRHLRELLN